MSLVITSSNQDKYDESSLGDGITRSFSYQNNMRSPLVIEPNSEIAVQSVKTTRQDNIVVSRDTQVGVYFGKQLSDAMLIRETPQAVVYADIEAGNYTKYSFSQALQKGLQDIYRGTYVNASSVSVEVKRDGTATNLFEGYTIAFQQMAGVVGNGSNTTLDYQPISAVNLNNKNTPDGESWLLTDDFTWTGDDTMTKGTDVLKSAVAVLDRNPLSATNGKVEFNLKTTQYPDGFLIGLTRGVAKSLIGPVAFDVSGQPPEEFYDYMLSWQSGGDLEVYQYEYGVGMLEVTPDASVIQNASMVVGEVEQFSFVKNGENISIQFYDFNTKTWADYVSAGTLKPAGLSCEMLYAKISLNADNSSAAIEVAHFSGVENAWSPKYTDDRFYGLRNEVSARRIDDQVDSDTSYYPDASYPAYVGLNASNGIDSVLSLIIGKSTTFDVPGVNKPNFGSIKTILGFQEITTIDQVPMGVVTTLNLVTFTSSATPEAGSLSNLFVRLNNLPFNSFNANKGSISKILYPLPRIDAAGKSFGSLYFEAQQRTYLKINNPGPITMTQISVDVVDINEQLATDLSGNTIVIFHIRKSV